ncbi:MAG: hypothetical protein JNM78_11900 [Cyclobacteriaceae bacterium]|nr:hypothetical protein [Cyclobacteriaceae bacterium]
MGLNEKISERFEIKLDASKQQIVDAIAIGKKNQKNSITADAFDRTNYKAIKIDCNRIETLRMPTILNPFRPYGRITININEDEIKQSILSCVILPSDGIFSIAVLLLVGFLVFWTTFLLILSMGNLKVLLVIIPGWLGVGITVYLGLLYTKSRLREYTKRLIKDIEVKRRLL